MAADGDGRWPRPAALLSLTVTDAPEPPRFDVEHYQFTVSEFEREGKYKAWRVRTRTHTREHNSNRTSDEVVVELRLTYS